MMRISAIADGPAGCRDGSVHLCDRADRVAHGVIGRIAVWFASGLYVGAALAQSNDDPKLSTREAYRACRFALVSFDQRRLEMDSRDSRHRAAALRLQNEASAYMTEKRRAGLKTPQEIAAYNQVVDQYNARTKAMNAESVALVKQQTAFNAEVLETNARCAGKMVPQEVADDVEREVQQSSQPR